MREQLLPVGDGFWNIRGSFKLGGVIQIGTQASLAQLDDGRFVLLDAYTLPAPILSEVRALTSGGRDIDAIINLHPFHTIHVERAHEQFPSARLLGSARHVHKASHLPWQDMRTDDDAMNEAFPGLAFSVPRGVDFISDDPNVHFSSVLAYHARSKTIHVDDTFNHLKLPVVGGLAFHPTLKQALEKRPGAADDFSRWAEDIATRWGGAQNICAAHNSVLLGIRDCGDRIRAAHRKVQRTLRAHRRAHG